MGPAARVEISKDCKWDFFLCCTPQGVESETFKKSVQLAGRWNTLTLCWKSLEFPEFGKLCPLIWVLIQVVILSTCFSRNWKSPNLFNVLIFGIFIVLTFKGSTNGLPGESSLFLLQIRWTKLFHESCQQAAKRSFIFTKPCLNALKDPRVGLSRGRRMIHVKHENPCGLHQCHPMFLFYSYQKHRRAHRMGIHLRIEHCSCNDNNIHVCM